MKKLFLFSALVIAAAGCSFFPSAGEPARKYTLSYTQFTPDVNNLKVRLLVDTPTVYSPLDTLRICLKNSERSIDYFADVEWANRLNSLIHESIIYSFENTGKFPSISRPADGANVDKTLKIEVRGFYMDFFSEPPQKLARVDYSVQIIDKVSRNVTATKAFRAQAYVNEDRIESYVQALNQAHLEATTQMIKWTVNTLKNAKPDYSTDDKESEGSGKKGSDSAGEKSSEAKSSSASAKSDTNDSPKSGGGEGSGSQGGGGGAAGGAGGDGSPKDSAMAKVGELKDKAGALKGAGASGSSDAGGGGDSSKGDSGSKSEGDSKKDSSSESDSKKDSSSESDSKKDSSSESDSKKDSSSESDSKKDSSSESDSKKDSSKKSSSNKGSSRRSSKK